MNIKQLLYKIVYDNIKLKDFVLQNSYKNITTKTIVIKIDLYKDSF